MKFHVSSNKNRTIAILSKQSMFNCKILEPYEEGIFDTEYPKIQITYYPTDFRLFLHYNTYPNLWANPTHQLLLNAEDIHKLKVVNRVGNLWEIRTDKEGNVFRIEMDSYNIDFSTFPDYASNLLDMNIMMGSYRDVVNLSFQFDKELA